MKFPCEMEIQPCTNYWPIIIWYMH